MAHLKTQIFCLNSLTHTLLFAALETNALITFSLIQTLRSTKL